ncbi:MAG: cysteine--tRNA ligase, partial [Treponema sp.]|nr:cysteine--tRNA ligase [Treponema sp.]
YFLLGAHYRSQVFFSIDAMQSAKNARLSLVKKIAQVQKLASGKSAEKLGDVASTSLQSFKEALENDLSSPRALSILQTSLKDSSISASEMLLLVSKMDSVLGLNLEKEAKLLNEKNDSAINLHDDDSEKEEIEELIAKRQEAKKAKDFATADKIRSSLAERGIIITDTSTGTIWKRSS